MAGNEKGAGLSQRLYKRKGPTAEAVGPTTHAYSWGQKLGTILQNGIVFGYSFLTTFDWNGLGAKLAGFVNGLLDKVDGAQLGALFAAKFTIAIRTLGTFLANLDWATLDNPLITDAAHALAVAEWVRDWLLLRNTYEFEYRGSPELDPGDLIWLESQFAPFAAPARVLKNELAFDGGLKGKMIAKRMVEE